jgi:hypothetical protein
MVREAESPMDKYTDPSDLRSIFAFNGVPVKIWVSLQCPTRHTFSEMIKVSPLFLLITYLRRMAEVYVIPNSVQISKSEITSSLTHVQARSPINGSKNASKTKNSKIQNHTGLQAHQKDLLQKLHEGMNSLHTMTKY